MCRSGGCVSRCFGGCRDGKTPFLPLLSLCFGREDQVFKCRMLKDSKLLVGEDMWQEVRREPGVTVWVASGHLSPPSFNPNATQAIPTVRDRD